MLSESLVVPTPNYSLTGALNQYSKQLLLTPAILPSLVQSVLHRVLVLQNHFYGAVLSPLMSPV